MVIATREFQGLGPQAIIDAYARLARSYDVWFGPLLAPARRETIKTINQMPGRDVLEVGVGTGLALPHYGQDKLITGIDVSADMLAKAQARAAPLTNVRAILQMDAQSTTFEDGQFDIAVAMFVASVVPSPRALLAEMRRVVKPGGSIIIVNHFAEEATAQWWRHVSGMVSARLGWRADFQLLDILDLSDRFYASVIPLLPFGFFKSVELRN